MNITVSPYEHTVSPTKVLSPSQESRILSHISICAARISFRSTITCFIKINKFKLDFRVKWKIYLFGTEHFRSVM